MTWSKTDSLYMFTCQLKYTTPYLTPPTLLARWTSLFQTKFNISPNPALPNLQYLHNNLCPTYSPGVRSHSQSTRRPEFGDGFTNDLMTIFTTYLKRKSHNIVHLTTATTSDVYYRPLKGNCIPSITAICGWPWVTSIMNSGGSRHLRTRRPPPPLLGF